MFSLITKLTPNLAKKTLITNLIPKNVVLTQVESFNYKSDDLWKSVLSVSSQGSKKGRGKRRGGGKSKDLNLGQQIGDGKLKVEWPGLNVDVLRKNVSKEVNQIKIIGEDVDREKRLVEIRNQMDKFRKLSVPPHERGFTGSSLDGKSIGQPISYDNVDFSGFDTRTIEYKTMVAHKSILGKKKTISCFVVTGNHNGVIGYGLGKSSTVNGAMRLAKLKASQRLLYIEKYEDRTLFHNFYEEYYFTKIYAEKMPKGYGLVCHRIIKVICKLIGIKDLYAKIEGSRNPKSITKAFLSGLLNQKKYSDISKETNLHVVEFKPEMNDYPLLLSKAETPIEENKLQSNDKYQRSINLYLFQNRYRLDKKKKFHFITTTLPTNSIDNELKKARLQRLIMLPDETLSVHKYPKKPKEKPVEEVQESQ